MAKFAKKAKKSKRFVRKSKKTFRAKTKKSFKKTRRVGGNNATITEIAAQYAVQPNQGYTILPNIADTTRSTIQMALFQEYRIKAVSIKLLPTYDQYNAGTVGLTGATPSFTAAPSLPEVFFMPMKSTEVPKYFGRNYMEQCAVKPHKLDKTMTFSVPLRLPQLSLNAALVGGKLDPVATNVNTNNTYLGKPSPWMPTQGTPSSAGEQTNIPNNQIHFGALMYVDQAVQSPSTYSVVAQAEVTYTIQFRKPIAAALTSGAATIDIVTGLTLN